MNSVRVKVGEVPVDSGGLVIADPAYIENLWRRQSESTPMGIYFFGGDAKRLFDYLESKDGRVAVYVARQDTYLAALKSPGRLEWLLGYIDAFVTDGYDISYEVAYKNDTFDETFWATDNENNAGRVDSIEGVSVLPGNGRYEVYATVAEDRLQKIEVEFF